MSSGGPRAYFGAIRGGFSALAFVPLCALVLAAAQRARRARRASLVAGAERRALWSILVETLALQHARDGPLQSHGQRVDRPCPRLGVMIAVVAGAVPRRLSSRRRPPARPVGAQWSADFEVLAPTEVRDAGAIPRFDLGLGDDVRVLVRRAADTYRSRVHPTALVLSNVTAARAALARALLL